MKNALSFAPHDLTEEMIDQYKIKLVASFNDAQSAWEAYRAHLREHGIFPVVPTTNV